MAHTMHAREIVSGGAVCGIDKQRGVEIFKTSEWARVDCRRCLRHKPPPADGAQEGKP